MALTLRTLCASRTLGLRLACPSADQDRPLTWVHSSELSDPTPYLDGDELLLTTGLGPAPDPAGYVARLVAHGLAGLGFGCGLGHDDLLPALREACERAGLALLEVPERTPFLALTKAVAEARAADRYAEWSAPTRRSGRSPRPPWVRTTRTPAPPGCWTGSPNASTPGR